MPPRRTDSTAPVPVVYQQGVDIGALQARVELLEQHLEAISAPPPPSTRPEGVLSFVEGQIGFKTFLLAVLLFTAMIFTSCAAYKIGGENLVRLVIELSRNRGSGSDKGAGG